MLHYVEYIETDTFELHLANNLVHCSPREALQPEFVITNGRRRAEPWIAAGPRLGQRLKIVYL
jgi:hypothetical protein